MVMIKILHSMTMQIFRLAWLRVVPNDQHTTGRGSIPAERPIVACSRLDRNFFLRMISFQN